MKKAAPFVLIGLTLAGFIWALAAFWSLMAQDAYIVARYAEIGLLGVLVTYAQLNPQGGI